jgi:hypothetical protein
MMQFIAILLAIFFFSFACTNKESNVISYPTYDYLLVKKKLDTINAEFNKSGYKPTFLKLTKNNKSLVFFGASHVRDTLHPQFKAVKDAFLAQKPQVAFNEGGQIPEEKTFKSEGEAILEDGETGLLKHLCNQSQIKLINGDMDTAEEFNGLLKAFPKDQVLLYLACERFLNPYKSGFLGDMPIEAAYQKDFLTYLTKYKFPLTTQNKSFPYLKSLYFKYFKKTLELKNLVEVHDYYLLNTGAFGDIGRKSKEIRDQALLLKIDLALDSNDRVFVVFGASHLVAVQPGLQYIIDKKRK